MFQRRVDEQIRLARLERRDAEELFRLTDASRESLRQWLPWLDAIRKPSDTATFIEVALDQDRRDDGFQAGIFYEETIAGVVGLHYIQRADRATSIGYWLGDPFRGRGIVTRSCAALIEHVFDDLDLHRVEIRAAVENERSRAVAERLGFLHEGTVRDGEWLYDHFVDLAVYGLLESDWRSRRARSR
jgi:ribosomal-protein-serine acetyltransferase